MPATQRNPRVRALVTIAIVASVIGFLAALFWQSQSGSAPAPPTASSAVTAPQGDTAASDVEAAGSQAPPPTPEPVATAQTEPAPAEPVVSTPPTNAPDPVDPSNPAETTAAASSGSADDTAAPTSLRARVFPQSATPTPLGSLDPASAARSRVEFTLAGAGVSSIQLAGYFETIEQAIAARSAPARAEGHYRLQSESRSGDLALVSLAALQLVVDGQDVNLFSVDGMPVWRETAPGSFVAEIEDTTTGAPVLRITRDYALLPGSFELEVRQRIENLTDRELRCRWKQYGPVDLNEDPSGYRIPTRRVRFGYLLDLQRDPSRQIVRADRKLTNHAKVLDWIGKAFWAPKLLWPDAERFEDAGESVWVAQTSRYFAFAVHPLFDHDAAAANLRDPAASPLDKRLTLVEDVHGIALGRGPDAHLVLQLSSPTFTLGAGEGIGLDFAAYAGPMSRRELGRKDQPSQRIISLADLVIYQIGMCGWCTFQPVARMLFSVLQFFHDYLVRDWALAIVLLVVCVRTLLHPIFKRSQVGMMRFGKQMQKVAPKQKKLQEKYKDDPQRLRAEMVKLMRDENVNYAAMLGCIPMFLQTPIWIALYAMLYFAFELRHQPAFFGVFQFVSGNNWLFLADLSRPDQLIPFAGTFEVPLLSALMGKFSGINILPLALGFVFYVHQKFLTPPTAATLSPEQQQQQKIVKVMMVVMFPVFMYNAPSGLTLYFITNSALAIIEGRYIRAHVDKMDLEPADAAKPAVLGKKQVRNEATPSNPFRRDRGPRKGPKGRG